MSYTTNLKNWGHAILDRVRRLDQAAYPTSTDHLLPIATGLLSGRHALRQSDPQTAQEHLVTSAAHLALVAFRSGDPELRVLDLVRLQRSRYDQHLPARGAGWKEHLPDEHFNRVIRQVLSVTRELDLAAPPAELRLQAQAADAANYLLFFLVRSGLDLESPESLSQPPAQLELTSLLEAHP